MAIKINEVEYKEITKQEYIDSKSNIRIVSYTQWVGGNPSLYSSVNFLNVNITDDNCAMVTWISYIRKENGSIAGTISEKFREDFYIRYKNCPRNLGWFDHVGDHVHKESFGSCDSRISAVFHGYNLMSQLTYNAQLQHQQKTDDEKKKKVIEARLQKKDTIVKQEFILNFNLRFKTRCVRLEDVVENIVRLSGEDQLVWTELMSKISYSDNDHN